MSLTAILAKIGDTNITVQNLVTDMTAGNVGKKGATITFATDPTFVAQLNKCAVLGETPQKIGLVIWVDSSAWGAAKASLAQPPQAPEPVNAELHTAASRVVELFNAQYLRANGDGGRSAHAIKALTVALQKGSQ